jgi:hypothetical protein
LLRLSQRKDIDQAGKDFVISYLKMPHQPTQPIAVSSSEKAGSTRVDQ